MAAAGGGGRWRALAVAGVTLQSGHWRQQPWWRWCRARRCSRVGCGDSGFWHGAAFGAVAGGVGGGGGEVRFSSSGGGGGGGRGSRTPAPLNNEHQTGCHPRPVVALLSGIRRVFLGTALGAVYVFVFLPGDPIRMSPRRVCVCVMQDEIAVPVLKHGAACVARKMFRSPIAITSPEITVLEFRGRHNSRVLQDSLRPPLRRRINHDSCPAVGPEPRQQLCVRRPSEAIPRKTRLRSRARALPGLLRLRESSSLTPFSAH